MMEPIPDFARCPLCTRMIRLRRTGDYTGVFWKHRDGTRNSGWCPGGGELPPTGGQATKMRRTECPVCHRDTAVRTNNTLARHLDPHHAAICDGSGQDGGTDNSTPAGTSWFMGGNALPSHIACLYCFQDIQVEPDDTYAIHTDTRGDTCSGSRRPAQSIIRSVYGTTATFNRGDRLAQWWRERAEHEIEMVVEKAVEYGATDLRDLGRQILEMAGRDTTDDDGYATEIGITFYAQGKLARIVAAVKEGRRPSLDSWLDLGVYARMAQRVHTHGGWPAL